MDAEKQTSKYISKLLRSIYLKTPHLRTPENIKSGDTLILAGSVPKSLSKDIYAQILSKVEGKGVITVVDAEKDYLLNCLKYKPFLIKPNKEELEALFNKKIESIEINPCA